MKLIMTALALGMTLCANSIVKADDSAHHHGVLITKAWSRVTTPTAKVGGGYLTIINQSDQDDQLIAVSSAHSGKAEVHTMTMQDDVMVMRPLDETLTIPAGERVALEPGGLHLMFMQLSQPHTVGEPFEATLTFALAGEKVVIFEVLSMKDSMDRMSERQEHSATSHDQHGTDHQ